LLLTGKIWPRSAGTAARWSVTRAMGPKRSPVRPWSTSTNEGGTGLPCPRVKPIIERGATRVGAARHGLQPGAGTDPEASAGSFSFPPAPAPRICPVAACPTGHSGSIGDHVRSAPLLCHPRRSSVVIS